MGITLSGAGTISSSTGAISFDDDNATTTGTLTAGAATFAGTAEIQSGVYIGGTAAANLLDDYEEGTFTITPTTAGYTIASYVARYTKIGRLVYTQGFVNFSAVPSNYSAVILDGLPFGVSFATPGVGREDTVSGDIFVVRAASSTNDFSINSMDGIAAGSNAIFATGRNYAFNLTYEA